jgi:hypothetical protein
LEELLEKTDKLLMGLEGEVEFCLAKFQEMEKKSLEVLGVVR